MNDPTTRKDRLQSLVQSPDFDVASPRDGAIFHSNKTGGNRVEAEQRCDLYPGRYIILERTGGGRLLEREIEYGPGGDLSLSEADEIWALASGRFAREASGDVTCLVDGANRRSVFRQQDLALLLANARVTSINGVRKEKLLQLSLEQAYDMVRQITPQPRGPAARIELEPDAPAPRMPGEMPGLPRRRKEDD